MFEVAVLVVVDNHIKVAAASLYGQPPLSSSSPFGPGSTPGVAGMLDDESTPNRLNMPSMSDLYVISNVPSSDYCLNAQPVYHVVA